MEHECTIQKGASESKEKISFGDDEGEAHEMDNVFNPVSFTLSLSNGS
jgi:hypothetical protein